MPSDEMRPRRGADGRWELRPYLGTDRLTGKPIRPYRSWPADMGEDEVMRLAGEWLAGLAPSAAAKSARRLDSMLDAYVHDPARAFAAQTVTTYESCIRCYISPTIGSIPYDELQSHEVRAMYRILLTDRPHAYAIGRSTLRKVHALLSGAYRSWQRQLGRNPMLDVPSPTPEASSPISLDEWDQDELAAALAEAMENLRKNLLLFCYQLGYLRKGKERLNTSLNTLRPALTQYNQLAKDIRDKTKERRSLLSEKKALSAVHVFRHRELAAKIAALTEDLEELRSEKNMLLVSLAYTEEDAADKFPKDIAAMEQSLKRLEEQEQKYSAELDAALNEYAGLREQAQGFAPVQLYEARQAIRPGKEQEAENRAQQAYGEKYSPLLMFDSKKAVSRMLHEDIERQAVRRMMRQAHKEQQTFQKKKSEQER